MELAFALTFLVLLSVMWRRLQSGVSGASRNKKDTDSHGGHGNFGPTEHASRDFIAVMEKDHKNFIVFYGSQTGTAEGYALRLAKEGKTRFGLDTMVANVEDYDFANLDKLPGKNIAVFVMSTYGEGEPPDSTVEFYNFITASDRQFSNGSSLENVTYVAFGLGNKTYENYNATIRKISQALGDAGANRLADIGEADDAAGTTEEDFLEWKEIMWPACAKHTGMFEHKTAFEASFKVTELPHLSTESPEVYLGEPNAKHHRAEPRGDIVSGPFDAHNPFLAPVVTSRELFAPEAKNRSCVHLELSLVGSGLTYETGDHVAIWPVNPTAEVDRILRVLGLMDKKTTVVDVQSPDQSALVPFPTPTTYENIMRYYLEIGGQVSRQTVTDLVPFAPTAEAVQELEKLGADKELFHEQAKFLTLARLLERVGGKGVAWIKIPFSLVIESLSKSQPRFYSISSSSVVDPDHVSITVAVKSEAAHNREPSDPFCGVTSNYLRAVDRARSSLAKSNGIGTTYALDGPRGRHRREDQLRVAMHIRQSKFRLPKDPAIPIIMIGPGTGVAPFRGFIRERAEQSRKLSIGPSLLFFGCRRASEDFIYEEEWKNHQETLGDTFKLSTAFSREGPGKVYVQDLLRKQSAEVYSLLERGAHVYVCGDAKMARDVHNTLAAIITEGKSVPQQDANEDLKAMRLTGCYQELEHAARGYVHISALQGGYFTLPKKIFVADVPSDETSFVPSLAFLVSYNGTRKTSHGSRHLLFDLGLRRDPFGYTPQIQSHLENRRPIHFVPDVRQSLLDGGFDPGHIDEVILSHVHWDHVGTPSDFPSAKFFVGAGSLDILKNGLNGHMSHSNFQADLFDSLEVEELPDTKSPNAPGSGPGWRRMAGLDLLDFSGDGTLYIVDTPGHLTGHISLLGRVGEQRWVLLVGDACHDRRLLTGEARIAEWSDSEGRTCCIHMNKAQAMETLAKFRVWKEAALEAAVDMQIILAHDADWAAGSTQAFYPGRV
ncbi:hypothetical protein ACHAQA_005118 [Verticillium albo-atrum]